MKANSVAGQVARRNLIADLVYQVATGNPWQDVPAEDRIEMEKSVDVQKLTLDEWTAINDHFEGQLAAARGAA